MHTGLIYEARIRYSNCRIRYSKPILNQPRRKKHQFQPTRYHRRLVFRFQSKGSHLKEGPDDLQEQVQLKVFRFSYYLFFSYIIKSVTTWNLKRKPQFSNSPLYQTPRKFLSNSRLVDLSILLHKLGRIVLICDSKSFSPPFDKMVSRIQPRPNYKAHNNNIYL